MKDIKLSFTNKADESVDVFFENQEDLNNFLDAEQFGEVPQVEILESIELKKFGITLPRDSQGYEHDDETECSSKESAARIFQVRLPKTYQNLDAEDIIDYIHEL